MKNRIIAFAVSFSALLFSLGSFTLSAQDRNDPRVQSGAADLGPSEDEITLRQQGVDALARAKKLGKITACADPYNYPYSTSLGAPPGFDIDIFREIAKRAGLRAEMYWADTGTRGGLGRALRNSIGKGRCDIFLGLAIGIDESELKEHQLMLTKPYLGMGYVLIVQNNAADAKSLKDLKDRKIKIGVNMSTPADEYLFNNGYDFDPIFQTKRLYEAMVVHEKLDAGLVFSTTVGEARKDFPGLKFKVVEEFIPEPGLRWNASWAVTRKDASLKQFLEEQFAALLASGEMKRIVEAYGVPFFPPFAN